MNRIRIGDSFFINPVFAFIAPWLVVLIGQQLTLCGIIVSRYSSFYAIIIGNMLSSILIFCTYQLYKKKRLIHSLPEITFSRRFKSLTYIALAAFLTLEMAQVVVSRGFPLLWLVTGDGKTYIDFGITSLNGLLNALYLGSTTAYFLICLKEKRGWFLFFLLLMLPVFLVSRQLMISLFLQISCCLQIYRPHSFKKVVLILLLVLATFVVLGNFRTGVSTLTTLLQPAPFVPESLYSLLWIYAYIVTPFNNVNASIDEIQPLGMPYNECTMLVPTFLQKMLGLEIDSAGFELVNEKLNVSTFYLPLIQDFGNWYAFFAMCVLQILLTLSHRRVFESRQPIDVMRYSILYMIVVLALFSNLLLYLPVVFQLVMIYAIQFSLKRNEGLVVLRKSPAI